MIANDGEVYNNEAHPAEMLAINEKLVITSIQQQEHAQSARQAEQRMEAVLEQLRATHKTLHANHKQLQVMNAQLQSAYDREHRIAQALQRPLMLEVPEDAFPGLSVATLYTAAWEEAEVGGDFFDAYALPDGRVALAVGDTTGKGLAAAARAQECKDVLRAFLRLYPYYPALTLTRLNDYYTEAQSLDERETDAILALSLALVHPKTGEATLAWGGVERPLILRASGEVEELTGGGALIGIQPHMTFVDVTARLSPGDTVVLWTDGLSEARRGKTFLGQEGVIELLRATQGQGVRQMGESLLAGVRAFTNGRLQDDACLVLVRRV